MARKDRERAVVRRRELIDELGGQCVDCGTKGSKKPGSKKYLEIDHVNGRDYDLARMDPSWRVSTYWKEYREGVELAVRCRSCNASKQ